MRLKKPRQSVCLILWKEWNNMKKFIQILLALVLFGGAMLMTACGQENKYWEATSAKSTEFVEKQENGFLFAETPNITYTEGIQTQINNQVAEYEELSTNYFAILNNLMLMFKTHRVNLSIAPVVKNKETETLFAEFEKEMDDMQNAINTFLQSKLYFEEHVIANYNQSAALQELKNYKRDFSTIIYQALDFNQSFENLYTQAYLPFPKNEITVYQTGLENLMATVTANQLLRSFVLYAFDNSDGTMASDINRNAIDKLAQIQSALVAPVYKENKLVLINQVISFTTAFNVELDEYQQALAMVNLDQVRKNGRENYLKENKSHEAYLVKIEEFNNTTVVLYANKVLELIA